MWFSTLCLYYNAHIHKKSGVGASSVQSDDPSKDNYSNKGQSSKPEYNQEQRQNSSQAKSEKESGRSKTTQTGKGKQRNKKLDTLGGYAG